MQLFNLLSEDFSGPPVVLAQTDRKRVSWSHSKNSFRNVRKEGARKSFRCLRCGLLRVLILGNGFGIAKGMASTQALSSQCSTAATPYDIGYTKRNDLHVLCC